MANLDKKTIRSLIQLSRIDCSEEEQEALLKDLAKILAYIDQLNEINTDNVAVCNHVLEGVANVMRDDEIGSTMPRDVFLANAPSKVGGMIRVPPILKSS
jgi:aspartyl-tRNA(Asn)/glutamyl-tRNA(Gln) amidotransferase subunit C